MEKELILTVDDNAVILRHVQKLLGEEYRIAAAISGQTALGLVSRAQPVLILLDVNMPEMDGFETLERIRELPGGQSIPVIFLTGDDDAETESRCWAAGAVDFLTKPIIPTALIEKVRRVLTR